MNERLRELGTLWEYFAETLRGQNAPIYDRIARAVAVDKDVLRIVEAAPPAAHLPLALLAAVHYLLLDGLDHPLADVYAGRSEADAPLLFRECCLEHRRELGELLAFRHVQTNEVGRCALFGPALAVIAERLGEPLALVDVGASAGLNLRIDRYRLDYGSVGTTGPEDAPVHVRCRVAGGNPPIRTAIPPLAAAVGIDRDPVDVSNPDDARWLAACVWPESGRVPRTQRAIEEARQDPPRVIKGDAVETLPSVVADLPRDAMACVLTSWSYSYFPVEMREAFIRLLGELALERPLIWLYGDGPGIGEALGERGPDDFVLGLVEFDSGTAIPSLLASVQPHGDWLDWRAGVRPE